MRIRFISVATCRRPISVPWVQKVAPDPAEVVPDFWTGA